MKRYPKWWISTLAACWLLGAATAQDGNPIESSHDSQQIETASQPVEFVPKRVIVKFRPESAPAAVQMITNALLTEVEGSIPELGVLFLKIPDDADEKDYETLFQSLPAVEYAELDYIVPPATSSYSRTILPNDPWFNPDHESYQYGWHLTRVGAPAAWYYQRGNPRIIVALIDTGVNVVSDLMGALVLGWNFYDNNTDTHDINGHGTSVAGVLAARTNNGIGVAGVTWNCRIMPLRIAAPNGNGSYGVAAQAIVWAANNGARVVNLSWAMGQSELVRDAARYFMQTARGVVVIPAGNDGLPASGNPPDNPYLLRVSAINRENVRAPFSGYGTDLDICAPGDDIVTTLRNNIYSLADGTSFSAPIVAGVAALALSANPYLSGEQLQNILKETAVDIGPPGWDWEHGWGCVNAYRVVMRARGLLPETTPPSIRFTTHRNGDVVNGAFWVAFEADDMSGLSHVELWVDRTYTSETPVKIGYKVNRPYRFWWDSRTVPPGTRILTAVAYDGAGNRGIYPLQVYVNNPEDRHPPTVVITSINGQPPTDGMVLEGTGLVVEVDARDDAGVVRAELYVDGTHRYTTIVPPFTFRGSTSSWASGEHTLEVRVYDGVGRMGISQTVRVIKP